MFFQLLEITQHFGFAVMSVEHRMTQIRRTALQPGRNAGCQRFSVQVIDVKPMIGTEKHIEQLRHGGFVTGFVETEAELSTAENAQIDLRRLGTFNDRRLSATDLQGQGVEEVLVETRNAVTLQAGSEDAG